MGPTDRRSTDRPGASPGGIPTRGRDEERLAEELAALARLHELVARLHPCPDLPAALEAILDAATATRGADRGNVQLVDPASGTLEIVAHRGFSQDFLDHFRAVTSDDDSACGAALKSRARVVIEDVQSSHLSAAFRAAAASAGFRAVQSTPLLGRAGEVLGVLSTHYQQPHRPSEFDLRLLDLYARQAADFIERQRSEAALRRLNEEFGRRMGEQTQEVRRLLAIIDTAHDAIYTRSLDGTITTWNKGAERLYGFAAAEAIGKPYLMVVPLDCRAGMEERHERLRRGELVAPFETRRVRKDGQTVIVSIALSAVEDADGRVVGVASIGRDVTARKRAEEALRQSEERLRFTLEAAGAGAWDWDLGTGRVHWSDSLEAMHGMEPGRFDGTLEGVLRGVHPEDRERFQQTVARAAEQGGEFQVEYRLRTSGEATRWVEGRGRVLSEDGRPARMAGICMDVTRRKRAEQSLDESMERLRRLHERLHQVTDLMSAPVALCSRDLRYVWVSRPYAERVGRSPDEIAGRPIVEVLGPEAFQKLLPHFEAVLSGQEVRYEEELVHPRLGPRWVSAAYTPTFGPWGVADGWVAVVIDVDERKRAEQALARRAAQQAAVAGISQKALVERDLTALMSEAARTVAAVLGTEYCEVLELLPGGGELFLRAGVGWREGLVGRATVGAGLESQAGYTLLAGGPVVVDDLAAETRFRAPPLLLDHEVVSGVSCPIAGPARHAYGVLGAHAARRRAFAPEDVYFLEAVANVLGGAIQRRHVEEALERSESRLRAIVNTAADAIVTIDPLGVIDSVNPAAERMFGYPAAEMLGRNVTLLMPPPYREEHDRYLARYRRTGERRVIGIGREVEGRRKDGSVFPVDLAISEVGRLGLCTGFLRDVTRRKELEREVVEAASLEQRRIAQDLHDSVAQELTALSLFAGELTQTLSDGPAAAQRLAARIAQGLGRGQQELRAVMRGMLPVPVEKEGLMAALADLAERTQAEGAVACTFDCPEPVTLADNLTATHLYLIAQEAVRNAVKHARPRHVRISLLSDHLLTVRVQDDGAGMQAPAAEGGGLGLRVMRNRAAIIGATLTVEPAEPSGTAVTCVLRRSEHERGHAGQAIEAPDRR